MKVKVMASEHKSAANINHLIGKVFEAKITSDPSVVEIFDGVEMIPLFSGEWEMTAQQNKHFFTKGEMLDRYNQVVRDFNNLTPGLNLEHATWNDHIDEDTIETLQEDYEITAKQLKTIKV